MYGYVKLPGGVWIYYVDTNFMASRYFFLLRDVYHLLCITEVGQRYGPSLIWARTSEACTHKNGVNPAKQGNTSTHAIPVWIGFCGILCYPRLAIFDAYLVHMQDKLICFNRRSHWVKPITFAEALVVLIFAHISKTYSTVHTTWPHLLLDDGNYVGLIGDHITLKGPVFTYTPGKEQTFHKHKIFQKKCQPRINKPL